MSKLFPLFCLVSPVCKGHARLFGPVADKGLQESPEKRSGNFGKANFKVSDASFQFVVHGVNYSVHAVNYSVHTVNYSVHAVNYRLYFDVPVFSVRIPEVSGLLFPTFLSGPSGWPSFTVFSPENVRLCRRIGQKKKGHIRFCSRCGHRTVFCRFSGQVHFIGCGR